MNPIPNVIEMKFPSYHGDYDGFELVGGNLSASDGERPFLMNKIRLVDQLVTIFLVTIRSILWRTSKK